MGCVFNFEKLNVKSDEDALSLGREMIRQASFENGHGGYTGSYAECMGVQLVRPAVSLDEVEAWLDENAEKWGPMLIAKIGDQYFAGANCSS